MAYFIHAFLCFFREAWTNLAKPCNCMCVGDKEGWKNCTHLQGKDVDVMDVRDVDVQFNQLLSTTSTTHWKSRYWKWMNFGNVNPISQNKASVLPPKQFPCWYGQYMVNIPLFIGFYTSQVVVWDFCTINSISITILYILLFGYISLGEQFQWFHHTPIVHGWFEGVKGVKWGYSLEN